MELFDDIRPEIYAEIVRARGTGMTYTKFRLFVDVHERDVTSGKCSCGQIGHYISYNTDDLGFCVLCNECYGEIGNG